MPSLHRCIVIPEASDEVLEDVVRVLEQEELGEAEQQLLETVAGRPQFVGEGELARLRNLEENIVLASRKRRGEKRRGGEKRIH
jgi:hypothetical protein